MLSYALLCQIMRTFRCLRDLRFEIDIRSRKTLNKNSFLLLIVANKITLFFIK